MDARTVLETVEDLAAVVTLPLGVLAAVLVGWETAAVVFVVGWLFVVPVADELADRVPDRETASDGDADETTDPLETLRERYAAGEIDDREFERRLEDLVATEGVEVPPELDVADGRASDADAVGTDRRRDGDRATDDGREPAREREG